MQDFCPICYGAGGAIGSGYGTRQPCHAGPYSQGYRAIVTDGKIIAVPSVSGTHPTPDVALQSLAQELYDSLEAVQGGQPINKIYGAIVKKLGGLPRAELDPTKGACPKCGWPLDDEDDYNGDGFATCPCGASVDLEAI